MKPKRARHYLALASILLLLVLFLVGLLEVRRSSSGGEAVLGALQNVARKEEAASDSSEEAGDACEPSHDASDAMVSSYQSDKETELIDSAAKVLEDYRDQGDCLLRWAGYLDLFGGAWGCVVEGPGWVDVVIVREKDGGSEEKVVRLNPRAWEEELKKSGR